jgi:hypothetical protein
MNSLFGPKNNNAPKQEEQRFSSNETTNEGIHSFSEFGYKDGRFSQGSAERIPRENIKIKDIIDTPITITGVHERVSKLGNGGTYLTIDLEKDGKNYYCNTSGKTIKKQLEDRVGITYPFNATIKEVTKQDGSNLKYYKLS